MTNLLDRFICAKALDRKIAGGGTGVVGRMSVPSGGQHY